MSDSDSHPPRVTSSGAPPRRRWVRMLLLVALVVAVVLFGRPIVHLIKTAWRDVDDTETLPPGVVDDASRMNRTDVAEVWPVPSDPAQAERQLAELLARARRDKLRVSIAGARHSMGGHTIYPGGLVIDMLPLAELSLDEEKNILHVGAGARWRDVIAYLDAHGRAVAVMQSNNDFSVGGSISVNCHGWQFGAPPISSTVESLRLMKTDGQIVRCSRTEHEELFSLVLGGYGLFGIILDVDLRVVPNERYRLEQFVVPVEKALATFDKQVENRPDAVLVYARMGVVPDNFLKEVIINVLRRDPAPDGALPPLSQPGLVELRRSLFRGSAGSDYGKQLRWEAETKLQPHLSQTHYSRNQLFNEAAAVFQDRSAATTDILHEYFVPRSGLPALIAAMREIIPRHGCDLLNITVRYVDTDEDTLLRYADRPMFSLVMLFNQPRNTAGDEKMQAMTRELIDAALSAGGRYYLPYRLHATPEQFRRAYPQAEEFFELKRKYDPEELFQNQFYVKYGGKEGS